MTVSIENETSDNNICIKNMVCPRCIRVIQEQFALLKLPVLEVQLGQVDFTRPLYSQELEGVRTVLQDYGFELLEDKKAKLVEQIKTLLIEEIHYKEEKITSNYSTYLAQTLGKDYSTLSNAFSSQEKVTIEKFIILQKVEYIKAHLEYDELPLGHIASRLHYSSLSHLSRQFKSVTGYSPSEYRRLRVKSRRPLDQVS